MFFGFQKKNEYFLGFENFVDILFWGLHKIELYFGVISMHLRAFLKNKVQNEGIFWGCKNFQYFL